MVIDFLQSLFIFSLVSTPIVAAVAFLLGLTTKKVRLGIWYGLLLGVIGYAIGVSLGGGFGQTEGWGWGNVGAAILGFSYAAVGFLIGFGAFCQTKIETLGWFFVVAGLQFP